MMHSQFWKRKTLLMDYSMAHTVRKVLANFALQYVTDDAIYCKVPWDVKFCQIAGNVGKFSHTAMQ